MNPRKFLNIITAVCVLSALAACSVTPDISQQNANAEQKTTTVHKELHWSYKGKTGPENWAHLEPGFSMCADGREQSPIDIELANVNVDKTKENVKINYGPAAMTVINNGHTIQVNDVSGKHSIMADGKEYKLVQMHFHKPSEHRINSQPFAMEGHLVHKNNEGRLAVLGFFIKEGKENKQLAEIWSKLPKRKTKEEVRLDHPVDLTNLLPKDKSSFRYNGSLTTPPCSEGVKWIVFEMPIEMSKGQIAEFDSIFQDNHRPVQPLNDRQITAIES